MYNVTDNFIEQIGIAGKEKDTKIIVGENTIIPQSFKHSFSGNLFTSIMQKIEFEVKNGIVLTENTIIKPKYGLKVNGAFEYVNYSNYNVHTSEINYDTNIVKTVAYDNLIKFMIKWDVSKLNITFPTTILGLIQKICNYIGIQLYSTDFFNASLPIDTDLFTALNCTYRDVIDYICQATLTVAIIKDNKLYLKNVTNTNKTINPKMLKKFKLKQQFGGCNSLVLGRGDLNDNIYSKDEVLIAADGLQEIRFDNNEILDKRREQVIDSMFAQIKGLKYYAFETKDLGIGIFEPADICNVQDLNSNTYKVLVLNQSLTITSGCEGAMSAEVPETSTTKYKYATDSQKRQSKTEIIVDKQNKKIEAVVSDVDEQSEKISKVTQTLYKLQSEISEIADVTNSISGNGSVVLENINESEPVRIEIRPIGEDISYLYPSNTLYPADNLYLKNRKLKFENTNGYAVEWELPDDLLYYDSEHYDELILDYTGQSCVINKKVERNADGSKYLLTTPTTVSYEYPIIPLEEGDYTITVLGYDTAYLFVRLMIQNIYTDQFATKVEMNSSITQTKSNILETVSGTYATQTELGTVERKLTASLELKIDTKNLVSELNASADVINFEAGRLLITSGNFKLDRAGNITATGGTIGGFNIFEKYLANGTETLGGANNSVYLGTNGISCGTKFKVTNTGELTCSNANIIGGSIQLTGGESYDEDGLITINETAYNAAGIYRDGGPIKCYSDGELASLLISVNGIRHSYFEVDMQKDELFIFNMVDRDTNLLSYSSIGEIGYLQTNRLHNTTPAQTGSMIYNNKITTIQTNSYAVFDNVVQIAFSGYVSEAIAGFTELLTLPYNCKIKSGVNIYTGMQTIHEDSVYGYIEENTKNLRCKGIPAGKWVHIMFTYIRA